MDESTRRKISIAAKLLAKAESSSFDSEALAFSHQCYRTLALAINELEARQAKDAPIAPRERRLLFDRRKARIPENSRPDRGRAGDPAAAVARYQRAVGSTRSDGSIVDRSV